MQARDRSPDGPLTDLARDQGLVIARRQLIAEEGDANRARRELDAGRWQVVIPGIYATFTGPLPELSRLWACLLHAGPDAAAGGGTALWLAGVRARAPATIEVCVPHGRHVRPPLGSHITSRRDLAHLLHPARRPPMPRVEEAVLDVAAAARSPGAVVDVVLAAVQSRLTTPGRVGAALARRSRHRWRRLVGDLVAEVGAGVQSPLERHYLVHVERAHGLPRPDRNARRATVVPGVSEYPDLRYRRWRVVIELDGHAHHPLVLAFRDRARDNRAAVAGDLPLRYGWREVVTDPCGVAAQVADVLTARGWAGAARRCGPGCPVAPHRGDPRPIAHG